MSRLVLTNCHLIDGVAGGAQPDASVAIEDGLITRIATGGEKIDADGGRVIDARGGWLLPGLWDVHVHLMFPDAPPKTIPERVIKYGLNPNPPKDTDGRREGSGRGWVRELQGRWPGLLG